MMLASTVDRFFGTRFAVFFAGRLVLVFVLIAPSWSRGGHETHSIALPSIMDLAALPP